MITTLVRPRRAAVVLAAITALLGSIDARAQHNLPPVENQDLDHARGILERANTVLRDAPGFRYRAEAVHAASPPNPAVNGGRGTWEFIGGGGRFWSLAPANLTLSDGNRLYSIDVSRSNYTTADIPEPDELRDAIGELSDGFGQDWLAHLALDPSRSVHTQVDYQDFEILGTRREAIEGEPGEWVYMAWTDEDDQRHVISRAWHSDALGFPLVWEYDQSDWFDLESLGRLSRSPVDYVVYRVSATEFELLDEQPDQAVFAFDDQGLTKVESLFDFNAHFDGFDEEFGFGEDMEQPMPDFLGLNEDALTLGRRYGSLSSTPDLIDMDLDGDGTTETVAWAYGARVVVFPRDGGRSRSIRFRGLDENEWTINSFTPVHAPEAPGFAVEMERYNQDDWTLAEVVLCFYDTQGREVWRTVADQNIAGATNFTYLTSADLTGDGTPEIVLGRHYVSSADWGSGQGMIEVYDTNGLMLSRAEVGEAVDGIATLDTDNGPVVIAIVNGSARVVEFDPDAVTDRSGPPVREPREPEPNAPGERGRNDAPIF